MKNFKNNLGLKLFGGRMPLQTRPLYKLLVNQIKYKTYLTKIKKQPKK